jgi:hypothetical protein
MPPNTNTPNMTSWQAIQAAMLYQFASTDYLKNLHTIVTSLIDGVVDPLLELAKVQGRDLVIENDRWGKRDTSENWANNAWPHLKDLQLSLARDIARRAFGEYEKTAVNECLRAAEQFSMLWATDDEEDRYRAAVQLINHHAGRIDKTLATRANEWNDFRFMTTYPAFRREFQLVPVVQIRTDISGVTGQVPPRTGVYICASDLYATLQFAWAGRQGCPLRKANTFNDIGLAALAYVGRADLWTNHQKMYQFVKQPSLIGQFRKSISSSGTEYPDLAASAVARSAFEEGPLSTWYFVEIVPNKSHSSDIDWNEGNASTTPARVLGGDVCTTGGYYFSPARVDSRRYFSAGEKMPIFTSDYGATIWQWDSNQS